MAEIASLFEYYYSNLENNFVFNCTELAKRFGLNDLIPNLSKSGNLKIFYDTLNDLSSEKYHTKTRTLFPNLFYEVRNSVFHMDYYFEKLPPHNFKIYLTMDGRYSINFDDLIILSKDILSKINSLKVIAHYFKVDPNLPLRGY